MNVESDNRTAAANQAAAAAVPALSAFAVAAGFLARQVALREFSLRERRILAFLYEAGPGQGHAYAYVPGLKYFAEATGMSEGHVSHHLGCLKRALVIEEKQKDYYAFRLPVGHWEVPLQIGLSVLGEVLGLRDDRDPFTGAMQETFVEILAREARGFAGTPQGAGKRHRVPESGTQVPESGTGCRKAAPREVPESGTSQNPLPERVSAAVPESGTPAPRARAFNVKPSTVNEDITNVQRSKASPGAGIRHPVRPPLGWIREKQLMREITQFFQPDFPEEMKQSGKFWRCRCVRNFPDAVEEALSEARYLTQTKAKPFDHKPSWLNYQVRMAAGVESWDQVTAGPRPTGA